MTELDAELIPLTLETIEEYGKLIHYEYAGASNYNPATQTNTPAVIAPGDFKVAPPEDYDGRTIANSGGLIELGDKRVYAAAASFTREPSNSDKLTFQLEGSVWTVKRVKTVYSGELPCLYELQITQ